MLPKNRKPTHPGQLLGETLEEMKITQTELAARLDVSFQTINTLVNEKRGMTADIAVGLAKVFDVSPQMWMALQTNLDLWNAQRKHAAHG